MHRIGAYPPLLSRVPVAGQGSQRAGSDGPVFQSERFGQPTLERLRFPAASASSRQQQLQRRQARFRRRGEKTGDDELAVHQAPSSTTDRKSTRLNSSHGYISYAVFCLKKKKHTQIDRHNITTLI